jgi:hypothetical protein
MEAQPITPAKKPWYKRLFKLFLWLSGSFVFLLLVLVGLIFLYEDKIKAYVIEEVNARLNTTLYIEPQNIDVTFIRSFPRVSVEFNDVAALDAINIKNRDTLFSAEKIALEFSATDIFKGNYSISHISLRDGTVAMWIDKKGRDNFHFLKPAGNDTSNSNVAFSLEEISLRNVDFQFKDARSKTKYHVHFTDVLLGGNFTEQQFNFSTEADFIAHEIKLDKTALFAGKKGHLQLEADCNTESGTYSITSGDLKVGALKLKLSGTVNDQPHQLLLALKAEGEDVDITSALSLLPSSQQEEIKDYESEGDFYFVADINGAYNDSLLPDVKADFGIRKGATITRKSSGVTLRNVQLAGKFSNVKGEDGLRLTSFQANTEQSSFSGNFSMAPFNNPLYEAQITGNLQLSELQNFLAIDTVESMTGAATVNLNFNGKPGHSGSLTANDLRAFKSSGKMELKQVAVKFKDGTLHADSVNGKMDFDGNNVAVQEFSGRYGQSDFVLNGNVRNLLGYLFTNEEQLVIEANHASRRINLDELLADDPQKSAKAQNSEYKFHLPERVRVVLNTAVRDIQFRRFKATSLTSTVTMNEQQLAAEETQFTTMDGAVMGALHIRSGRNDSLLITGNAKLSRVDMSQMFYQMENFGQTPGEEAIVDKNIKGKITSDIEFVTVWSNTLNMNEDKLYAFMDVTIDQGQLTDFSPLYSLAKFIKLDDLRDIKFKTLKNQIEIRNRIITIPKMDILSSAINISMGGTHNFDNVVDYHFTIDLDELKWKKAKAAKKENSEFGVEENDGGHRTRLFLTMKGPVDNPDIKYDTKGAIQQIKDDVQTEKQNMKVILNEEFGWFKKDSTVTGQQTPKENRKDRKKNEEEGKFSIDKGSGKKDEEEDDF